MVAWPREDLSRTAEHASVTMSGEVVSSTLVQPHQAVASGLNMDVWAHVLCFCDASSIGAFACGAAWSGSVFSAHIVGSTKPVEAGSFRRRWQESVTVGDRLDAMDVEGRWFEADVIAGDEKSLDVHYRSWNSSFDQTFERTSPRLAPLFAHSTDWRPKLRKGQLIEAKKDRCWYLAIILSVSTGPRKQEQYQSRWAKLTAIGVNSAREDDTLKVVTPNVPNPTAHHDLLSWTITDFDSEDIAPLGTHIRPGEVGKHYTTNNITMPMSLMIELMAPP